MEAAKYVNVELWQDNGLVHFGFFVPVPGGTFDYELVDFDRLYTRVQIKSLELQDLREELERLPCCTTNAAGGVYGDPQPGRRRSWKRTFLRPSCVVIGMPRMR